VSYLGDSQICDVAMKDRRKQNLILPSERQNSLSITQNNPPKNILGKSLPNLSVRYHIIISPVFKTVCPSPPIASSKQSIPKYCGANPRQI
jgi:hypothetical protein